MAYPAAMRSSLTELRRLCRHHCPAGEVSKSRKSGSIECKTKRRRATMAMILGRLVSVKLGSRTSSAKNVVAVDFAVRSRHDGRSLLPPLLQKEQQNDVSSPARPRRV